MISLAFFYIQLFIRKKIVSSFFTNLFLIINSNNVITSQSNNPKLKFQFEFNHWFEHLLVSYDHSIHFFKIISLRTQPETQTHTHT